MLALGASVVLSSVVAGTLVFSSQNYGNASRSKADQAAFALAEAGLNNALAVLSNPVNDPTNTALLPQRTTSYETGKAIWSGTYDSATELWSLTSTGEARNPTGPAAAPVRRTLRMQVPVTASSSATGRLANDAWNYVMATRTGNACDMTLAADVNLNTRLYVTGNLCFSSGAKITGGSLMVKDKLSLGATSNTVGASGAPITEVHVGTGCKYASQHWHPDGSHATHAFCSATDKVYATTLNQAVPAVTAPAPDWDTWYAQAAPGPKKGCTTSSGPVPVFDNDALRNKSVATNADLTPSTSYSCVVGPSVAPLAELSWNSAARVLKVKGTFFIDGSATVGNGALNTYDGQGTLYLSGSLVLTAGSKLCALASASDCTTAGWDPNTRLFAVVANGNGDGGSMVGDSIQLSSYTQFQGAMFATNTLRFGTGSRGFGPMIGNNVITCSGLVLEPFPLLVTVPAGLPGQPIRSGQIGSPSNFSG